MPFPNSFDYFWPCSVFYWILEWLLHFVSSVHLLGKPFTSPLFWVSFCFVDEVCFWYVVDWWTPFKYPVCWPVSFYRWIESIDVERYWWRMLVSSCHFVVGGDTVCLFVLPLFWFWCEMTNFLCFLGYSYLHCVGIFLLVYSTGLD